MLDNYIQTNKIKLLKEYDINEEDFKKIVNRIYVELCNYNDFSNDTNLQLGTTSFQCYDFLTPIYFDHKVADNISTFQKLIYFGSYPTTKKCEFLPLINGEHINEELEIEKMYKKFHCHYFIDNMEEKFPSTYTGEKKYKTFYKNIIYKSNGKKIDDNNNIVDEIIKSQQQDGGTKKRKSKKIKKSKKSRKIRKSKK